MADILSFPIFKPKEKKFELTPNLTVFGLWFSSIAIFGAFDGYGFFESIKTPWLVIVFVVSMYFLITSYFQYKPLNGFFDGEIMFQKDRIVAKETTYDLKNITKLYLGFADYHGEQSLSGKDFNPKLYQGVNNFVSFVDKTTGDEVKIYFKLFSKNEHLMLYPFINDAVQAGAMTYYQAIDLIDVENVTKPVNI